MGDNLIQTEHDANQVATTIRREVIENVQQYVGLEEIGGDNRGPLVAAFLRADEYTKELVGQAAPEGSSWCAGLVSFVLKEELPDALPYSVVAKGVMREAMDVDAYYRVGDYSPREGDLIFFERGKTGDWRGHVGFVESVDADGTVHTIEGNKSDPDDAVRPDGVRRSSYAPNEFAQNRVLGFADITTIAQNSTRDFSTQPELPLNVANTGTPIDNIDNEMAGGAGAGITDPVAILDPHLAI